MNFVHPSISSTIVDNSVTFITAQGSTMKFAVITSDLGVDNKITTVTSPTEFLFNHGNIDISKHGQIGYNCMNWLQSNGGLYVLRVMPDNAGYSHVTVNIQSKVSSKSVLDASGNIITVPDVTLRPTVFYAQNNNTSIGALEYELAKEHDKTVDGYDNNLLFTLIPRGRGKGYDGLGAKLTLTEEYNDTYSFRVYDFEVTKTNANGTVATIQGPFKVSLSPTAVSKSNESMFIKYVVEKYTDYYSVLFNEKAFAKLGSIINPYTHPEVIDVFNGNTRIINGVTETVFNELTGKDEDVHFYLHSYVNQTFNNKVNIVNVDNIIEDTIINIDNSVRNSKYNVMKSSIERMKVAFSKIKKNVYPALVDPYIGTDGHASKFMAQVTTLFGEITTAETSYETASTPENLDKLNKALSALELYILGSIKVLYEGLDYARTVEENASTTDLLVDILKVEADVSTMDTFSLNASDVSTKLLDANKVLITATTSGIETKVEALNEVLRVTNSCLINFQGIDVADEAEGNATLAALSTSLKNFAILIEDITSPFTIAEDQAEYIIQAMAMADKLIKDCEIVNTLMLVERKLAGFKALAPKCIDASNSVINAIEVAKIKVATVDLETIKNTISFNESKLNDSRNITYIVKGHNYNFAAKLLYGSDGDLDMSNPNRAKVRDSLLVKGYTGTIDSDLLNKDIYPIDMVMDANYSLPVKNAMIKLVTDIRRDFMGILDMGFQATPQQTIEYRRNLLQVSNPFIALFGQDFIVDDAEYSGSNIKVTSTYFLSSKIPTNDNQFGIHKNFVGRRRGTISGYTSMNFNPNSAWKDQLYRAQINYVEKDTTSTRFNSQLTSQTVVSALSNICNVRTILRIQRDVEKLMASYQFEYNNTETHTNAQNELNGYLSQWVSNNACQSITGTVYASEYDKSQKLMRVKIELVFTGIIERIAIDLVVNG